MAALHPALTAIAALLPTLPDAGIRRRLELALTAPENVSLELPDRVLSPAETARAFSVTTKTIFRMAAEGALHRVRLPNRSRGIGFLQFEVIALLARCARGA